MFEHSCEIRVRYGETDRMGYVYYGNYTLYYEQGRTEAIKSLGLSYKQLEDELNVMMPVGDLKIKYRAAASYDDLLIVKTSVRELPTRKMIFHTEIFNEEGKLLNIGETTLIFVNAHTRKSCSAPDVLLEKLRPYFQ